jgi:hypothetical protein
LDLIPSLREDGVDFGGRPLRFGAEPYCEEKEVDGREGTVYVPPPAAKADVVGGTFFDLLKLARRLPSMLGGIVSLIFKDGSFGVITGDAVEDEAIETTGILLLLLALALVVEVV